MEAEPSAVELIDPESTKEEITEIYHDMYQLQRSMGKMLCGKEMEEQPQHFWKTKLRGWAALSATVTNAPEATKHLGSCWQRSQMLGHQTKVPQVMLCHGDPA